MKQLHKRIITGGLSSFLIFLLLILSACNSQKSEIEFALKEAGKNRGELEAVLSHYTELNDTLKLKAAQYLIQYMPYHFSQEEYFLSPKGEKYRPDISSFSDDEAVKSYCDSLTRYGDYRISRKKIHDISSLDSSFLVNNIELAFEVWQKPWARNISFDDFCKYILPYRAQTEMPSDLRREMMERFVPLLDSAKVQTPLEACITLQKHLKEIIKYKNTGLSLYPTIDETYRSGIGLCDDLCNLGIFIMRAVGIPVSIDQTIWTKMDWGHVWCVVWDNGRFYSFDPEGQKPILHALDFSEKRNLRPAKVYRNRFAPDLTQSNTNDDGYITFLKNPLIHDVTDEYLDKTTSLRVFVDKQKIKTGKSNQVYLCTHNYYAWQPIAIGQREGNNCRFDQVVGDNIFMVADSPEGNRLRFITAPFYVDREGYTRKFIPQKEYMQTFTFDKRKNKLNQEHRLHYWEPDKNRFVPLQYASETDTTQTYDCIPRNALLWYTIPERIANQRLLFIENDSLKRY